MFTQITSICNSLTVKEVFYHYNYNLTQIVTPVNANRLEFMLHKSGYDEVETAFLVDGFHNGFDLGYCGPTKRQDRSKNIPFINGIGDKFVLWEKVMKEVQAKRYAGPFVKPPFKYYVQSPIGLVPKAGNKTRQIFHLSYDFGKEENQKSINHFIPREWCTVKYNDLDHAVQNCIQILDQFPDTMLALGLTDLSNAFRVLPTKRKNWALTLMIAEDPISGKTYFFSDKNLPFGSAISCSHYQRFSNCLAHLVKYVLNLKYKPAVTNYLDDFLFIATSKQVCNLMLDTFFHLCNSLGVPIAEEKTVKATNQLVFLGILIDGARHVLAVPESKKERASALLKAFLNRKKATVKDIQRLTGLLNFLNKAIVPGRAFTRFMYDRISGKCANLRDYHHINLNKDFRDDCLTWLDFLDGNKYSESVCCRPFLDLKHKLDATVLNFYTDATANEKLGCGGIFNSHWYWLKWDTSFIRKHKPSIQYLELYAVCVGVFIWTDLLKNTRFVVHCDNKTVVDILNDTFSHSRQCMILVRKLVLHALRNNFRVFARHVAGIHNNFSDLLSRQKLNKFFQTAKEQEVTFDENPCELPEQLWPMDKAWSY